MRKARFFAAFSAALIALSAVSCSKPIYVDDNVETTTEQITATGEGEKETTSSNKNKDTDDINSYIKVQNAKPAMWRITDPETGNEINMLGALRFSTKYTFDMPDYINEAYDSCTGVAVEYSITNMANITPGSEEFKKTQELYNRMAYNDGTTIKDHISAKTYEIAKEYLTENSYYNNMVESFVANGWVSQVNTVAIGKVENLVWETLDARFENRAKLDGKDIVGIVDIDMQIKTADACSDELADFMIYDTIRRVKDIRSFVSNLAYQHDCWARGDVDPLDEEYYWSDRSADLDDDYERYLDATLYPTNAVIAEKAENYLKNGEKYFFVVGVTHFSGARGVDDILEEKGYKVEMIK